MTSPLGHGLFITGTDTGVGKTLVTAALARRFLRAGLRVGVMKPVETGWAEDRDVCSDARRLQSAARSHDDLDLICPYRLRRPLAPHSAAEADGLRIDLIRILLAFHALAARHEVLLVEGAGGALVPLTDQTDMRDLMVRLALPVVVIGRAALGGVNHARLTIEALHASGLNVVAFLFNRTTDPATDTAREQERSTLDLLRARLAVPVLGPLPFQTDSTDRWDECVDRVADDPSLIALADLVHPPHP